ncbi:MAG: DUF362 domain-containing protein [Candidatus Eisenbacteria bacterium]
MNRRDHSAASARGSRFPNRREFLKITALGALAAVRSPAWAERLASLGPRLTAGRGNSIPGRMAILRDADMNGHTSTIDKLVVEENVRLGVRALTRISNDDAAFESLFPGLHDGSTIAIKVNCIGSVDSRWEVVRGIVSGLSLMRGGTYDVSRVTIYDREEDPISGHGYVASEFTFNGHTAYLCSNNNASGSGHQAVPGYDLSRHILDADHVINVPVLKSHTEPSNQITIALKNHYGSCDPQSLCGNIPGMLTLNADSYVKEKTRLIVTCALRATYTGGPTNPAQAWLTYPEGTPNSLFFTTDPVTNEYCGREMINAERQAHGWGIKPCPWIEQASGAPYDLGVSDPGLITIMNFEPEDVAVDEGAGRLALYLAPNSPNPFRESTTLRFLMPSGGRASLLILEPSGRLVRRLESQRFPAGPSEVMWDGRDARGRTVAAGVYLARIESAHEMRTRRMVKVR